VFLLFSLEATEGYVMLYSVQTVTANIIILLIHYLINILYHSLFSDVVIITAVLYSDPSR